MVVVYFFHFNMIEGLIHFNVLYSYWFSLVLQGSTNPASSGVLFISSFAGGGGEPSHQSGTSRTSEGSNFPGVSCHSRSTSQEGHLQMWGGRRTRETNWVRVQFLCSPRWHCCISFTKPLLIYLPQKENISFVVSDFIYIYILFEKVKKVYIYKILESPSKKHISLVILMQVWFPRKVEKKREEYWPKSPQRRLAWLRWRARNDPVQLEWPSLRQLDKHSTHKQQYELHSINVLILRTPRNRLSWT